MILVECRGAHLPLGIERRRRRQLKSGTVRTARPPVERLSPLRILGRSVVAPLGGRRRSARGELCQSVDGVLRLRRTRAIGRRSILGQADVMLLGRVQGGNGGQRGFALGRGRAGALLLLGGVVLLGRIRGGIGVAQRVEIERHAEGWARAGGATCALLAGVLRTLLLYDGRQGIGEMRRASVCSVWARMSSS